MRNAGFTPDCGCGPVIGEIRNGFKYPFGTVTTEQLRQVLTDVNNELERLGTTIHDLYEKNAVNTANITNNKESIADTRAAVSRMQESISQTRENVLALMASIEKVDGKTDLNTREIEDILLKFNELKNDVVSIVENIGARVYIQDSEPDDKDCIWIKPVNYSRMLMLNNDPEESDFVSSIDDRDYGIENAVKNTSDITKSNYCFDIIK